MHVDIREILYSPGKIEIKCDCNLPADDLQSVVSVKAPVRVEGYIENSAGLIDARISAPVEMVCKCDRCLIEYGRTEKLEIDARLKEELPEDADEDEFLIENGSVDISDIVYTTLILNMEQQLFCKEDCLGLCSTCGKNLNFGPCECKAEIDPRLAVLGQLLETK